MPTLNLVAQIQIRIVYDADVQNGIPAFSDALYYDATPTADQIHDDAQARYNGFVATLQAAQNASPPTPPTDDDLVAQIGSLADQQNTLVNLIIDPETQAMLQPPVAAVAQAVTDAGN